MKIKILAVGKTDDNHLDVLIKKYQKRLLRYINFEFEIIPDLKNTKNLNAEQQKVKEGQLILNRLSPSDTLILFDEKGKEFRSIELANFVQKKMNQGLKQLVFVIGGPYGFSKEVYQKASEKVSLSKLTFSHQMIRLLITEQLYRAFTILKNEPYHHE
ncbi:MAG: 23S rRNA (pseudouridine(1915)-N(3))-methyltransferase RlmH [Lutibacter sp.]